MILYNTQNSLEDQQMTALSDHTATKEVLTELLKDYKKHRDLLEEAGIFRELKKRQLEQ